ncbi:hypothetical protein Clacol_000966 [Clathrus columnatus]|uniref:Glycoside hydrolase family 5 domain-containing protein n=1 Tax=Clathrus columnatus TaxID=1419009 RepID=A0AAV5A191_9AGAM|nr:hypothetical protein Clacol_000966 [Clathrus columnatus]
MAHKRVVERSSQDKQQRVFLSERSLGEVDIYRYRRQYGVNLGSWFVLERWITDKPFREASPPASSDFDVATGNRPKEILENHWDTWITDGDWKWFVDHGINSVRLPIGYYHLYALDPAIVNGTSFNNVGWVFGGAWSRIWAAIEKAHSYGIGVLIGTSVLNRPLDLHAAPGKQNADAHSGVNGPITFYEKCNLEHTTKVLNVLAKQIANVPNVVGLELVNEPQNNRILGNWYEKTMNSLRNNIGMDLPLYISDCWDTYPYAKLIENRDDFVVLDHHLYRCYTSDDMKQSGEQLAASLPPKALIDGFGITKGNLVVAEFSAALNPSSLRSSEPPEQDRQRRVFARAELECFQASTAGFWFWTYKKDNGWDAGWSLRDTVRAEIMPNYFGIRPEEREQSQEANDERASQEAKLALAVHRDYWSQRGGKTSENWRFEQGFIQGWKDAFLFFKFRSNSNGDSINAVSELGFVGQWLKNRTAEHVLGKGGSPNVWEFEHGFRQGLDKAKTYFVQG